MKKNKNNEKNHSTLIFAGLSVVCIALLIGAYLLSREPETDFVPTSTVNTTQTDTWAENAAEDIVVPETSEESTSQVTGSETYSTQEVVSEDANETVTSLSDSTSKEDIEDSKPTEKPESTDDKTNPDKQPEYSDDVPQTGEPNVTDNSATDTSSDSHPGQVYDPVFGWITTGDTNQSAVDSDGDISKQVGTME